MAWQQWVLLALQLIRVPGSIHRAVTRDRPETPADKRNKAVTVEIIALLLVVASIGAVIISI